MRFVVVLTLLAGVAHADCPAAVKAAVDKKFPKANIAACKPEGKVIEVKATRADGKPVELDVTPDGTLVQIEEVVDVATVPAAVTKAFSARYANAKIERAEMQTKATGEVSFELKFGNKEATFASDGRFIEEE